MNKNKLPTKQEKILKKKQEEEKKSRCFDRNIKAMQWCNSQGLTIYASAQSFNSNMVKVFVQKGVPFKPLNNILYNQREPSDVIEYVAAIDLEYERLYLKMKDKV